MSSSCVNNLERRKRKSTSTTNSTDSIPDENDELLFFDGSCSPISTIKRQRTTTNEEIPTFRPDQKTVDVVNWLHKIDLLGDIYGWDQKNRQLFMQTRLRGSARDWYDVLEKYNLTWDDWKRALQTAFTHSTDFVDRLEEMLRRTKTDSETMTKYFQEKMSLLKQCKIEGQDAVSCIIKGLPLELRANAKAFKCETPEDFYFGYLSSFDNCKEVEPASVGKKTTWRRVHNGISTTLVGQALLPKICYSCRRPGHKARDCRSQLRCKSCHRTGHTMTSCWFGATSTQQ